MTGDGSRLPVVIVVAALAIIVLLAVGVLGNLERVEQTVRTPPVGPARENPFLAAERLLSRMGVRSVSTSRLDELPPPDHVIVLAAERRVLTHVRAMRLLDWVAEGGYLIVGPHLDDGRVTDETTNDPLLAELGVAVEKFTPDPERPLREVVEMESPADGEAAPVEFFAEFGLTTPEEEPDDPQAYALIWSDYGDGLAAVLNDLRFARSDEIGKLAHARFLWDLVRHLEARDSVLLVYGVGSESLGAVLFRHAWLALSAGFLLLSAWVWRSATRFGPRIPTPGPGNRSLLEHVEALGYFLWRANRADTFVAGARRALERQMQARRPDLARKSREHHVRELARHSGIDEPAVDAALFGAGSSRRENFTRTIRTLEQLRRAL